MSESISGRVVRVTFENEETNFRVLRVEVAGGATITAVGSFQFVAPGTDVRLTGEVVRDARHGEQFRVHTLVSVEPTTLEGIEKYLGSGLIPGVGQGFARRIVARFGTETLRVLDDQPERLSEVTGLGEKRIAEIREFWRGQRSLGQLMMLLQTHGIGGQLARAILERYGDRSAEIVQHSPYRLATEVRGIGFATADRLARSLGISRDHPDRVQAGVLYQLQREKDHGHVHSPRERLLTSSSELLEVDEIFVQSAIDAAWAAGKLVMEDDCVYLRALHRAEVGLCQEIQRVSSFGAPALARAEQALAAFEQRGGIVLAPQQRRAVEAVAEHKIVIITGGPGVGKTTIVRAVLGVFAAAGLSTRLAAPTGRAAKRMSEATGESATTLHRLLEFDPVRRRFQRDRDKPLETQAIVIDEASMVDLPLAESLFAAVPDPARVVIVGDVDQLPSVGPGAVLRDLIDSGRLCVVRLDQVFRQGHGSRIIQNAHGVLAGEAPRSAETQRSREPQHSREAQAGQLAEPNGEYEDFFVVQRTDPERAASTIEELVLHRIPQRFGFDPRTEIQVLSPMHKGPSGTLNLNSILQQRLNPTGPSLLRGGQHLRVGDKVMQLRNDYEKEVFNGDVGFVVSVDEETRMLSIDVDGRKLTYGESELDDLRLAYAVSIHKSQGSEYPAVVIPFLTAHFPMLSRNLLYTALTRASKLCVLVADPRAIRIALAETRREDRYTRLAERLRGAV